MSTGIIAGNTAGINVIKFTFDAASIAANTTAEQDVTISGVKVGDFVFVNKPSLSAGVGIANVRVKSANTVAITYVNSTADAVDPASEEYLLCVLRPEGLGTTKIST